ncbi:Protein of unknown function [Kaistia soli DSM 19436]|uniref:Cytochrome c domain-containing protein n=1 Tax=Kaistia soli DSM 19436 TaxID=1122133 RepID=A0A1M5G2X2_9HYPH|nr:DUF3365 domain-containing protein [Kaistia soli]SHF98059.1 Protein of unknown function [Kaistia soli DSM 19436]
MTRIGARLGGRQRSIGWKWIATGLCVATALVAIPVIGKTAESVAPPSLSSTVAGSPEAIASRLSTMLQSARAVISKHQTEINDPAVGDKHLDAAAVIAEATANYQKKTGEDPASYPPSTRQGRLIAAQLASIKEVMDDAQPLINEKGVAFKGFIPATFARLVNESFARRVGGEAHIKVTAPPELVRNRKARPDGWETAVIADKFRSPAWTRGTSFSEIVEANGGKEFRMAVPEYYAASCLSCHGAPKGSIDITGYPREGAAESDLGGVISVVLANP